MSRISSTGKIWSRFPVKKLDGSVVAMQIVDLSVDCLKEFMDFMMKYYVLRENSHIISGLPKNIEAIEEYKQILQNGIEKQFSEYKFVVCCPEDRQSGEPKIVGFSGLKLLKRGEEPEDIVECKTEEIKRLFEIVWLWKNLYPEPKLMDKYGIESFYTDQGLAVLPGYENGGIATELSFSRRKICAEFGVPLTGAWVTTKFSEKAGLNAGGEIVCEISREELSKALGVTLNHLSIIAKYMIFKPC